VWKSTVTPLQHRYLTYLPRATGLSRYVIQ